jgi:hypothetical protein
MGISRQAVTTDPEISVSVWTPETQVREKKIRPE